MAEGKPVIFLAFANDQQDQANYLRGLAQELRGIRSALTPAKRSGNVDIVERSNATLEDIIDVFQDPEYAGRIKVFHYGGHADSYRLMLESPAGNTEVAHSAGLARFLAGQKSLELVFLNGCSTREHSLDMLQAGIPATITTSHEINDDTARRFSLRLYKGLGAYASISKAYSDAQSEIITLTGPGNFRSLYWKKDENEPVPEEFPWKLLPEVESGWKIQVQNPIQNIEVGGVKVGEYAHVLLNRYEQDSEFISKFVTASQGRIPKSYLIHGSRAEKHESLITRFSYEYIGKKRYIKPIEMGNWPIKGAPRTLLKLKLTEQFEGLEVQDMNTLTASEVINHPAVRGQDAVILQYNLPGEYWNKDTADHINWYIGEFWNYIPENLDSPHFIIFINIYYSEELEKAGLFNRLFSKKYFKDKIIEELKRIEKRNDATCTLLTELQQIKKLHIEDWLISTNLGDLEFFSTLPDHIFPNSLAGTQELEMAKVELEVKKSLAEFKDIQARKLL